ncbi:MAG: Arylsulfatase precursor [Planctomycetota bacterium]
MTDDQGWGDLSMHGNPVLETPALDRLAQESVQLKQFYVHPVCTPTRAALFTGQHPQRGTAIDTYRGRAMLGTEAVTIAERMRGAGWATGIFGKWHLGDAAPMRPLDQGFERSLVHCGGGIGQPSDPVGAEGRYTDPVLQDQGEPVQHRGYCTEVYFREAMRWMETCREAGRPFFCAITPNAPHTPLHDVPADLYAKYKAKDLSAQAFAGESGWPATFGDQDQLARIYAMVEDIDRNVAALVKYLDEQRLAEDTLLLFCCDNGPQGRRYNQGLRAAKGEIHEGGVRSPLFVRWPAGLNAAVRSDGYAAHLDVAPTILEACGVDGAARDGLDGRSMIGLLRGEAAAVAAAKQRPLVIQWARGDFPVYGHQLFVRLGDDKLVQETAQWDEKVVTPPRWAPKLYDLAKDPFERVDLAAERAERVRELSAIYDAWYRDVTGWDERSATTRPAGERERFLAERYAPPAMHLGGPGAERVVLTRQDWRPDNRDGWGGNGSWFVKFADDAAWNARVHLQAGAQAQRVRLAVAVGTDREAVYESEVPAGAREVVIALPKAPRSDATVRLQATLVGGKRDGQGPHQVVLER